jgi:hypothetical protein
VVERAHPDADRVGVIWIAAEQRRPQFPQNHFSPPPVGFHIRNVSAPATILSVPCTGWARADAAAPLRRWQRLQWQ